MQSIKDIENKPEGRASERKEQKKMDNKVYCTAGRVQLTKVEAFEICESGKYVVTSYGIFQPQWHDNQPEQRVSFHKISDIHGIAKRGRYHTLTGDEINHVLGEQIFGNL